MSHKINNIDFDINNINSIKDIDNINDMIFDQDIVNIFTSSTAHKVVGEVSRIGNL